MLLATQGHIDQSIANHLGISPGTVKTYWGRIRTKLGAANRAELVARYSHLRASTLIDRLKTENLEFIDQIGELGRRERQLERSVSFLESIIEMAPDGILVIDPQGVIRLANSAASAILGYDTSELISMELGRLVPERFHGSHRAHREEYQNSPERRQMGGHLGTTAVRKDGSEVAIVATLNTCETASGTLVICILRTLTLDDP